MRKAVVILIAVILLLGVSGCESLRTYYINSSAANTESSPAHGKGISLADNAARQVVMANASNIATAINAYNALNPSSILPDDITMEEAKETVGDNLWPRGLSDEEAKEAWKYIAYKDGVAEIITE